MDINTILKLIAMENDILWQRKEQEFTLEEVIRWKVFLDEIHDDFQLNEDTLYHMSKEGFTNHYVNSSNVDNFQIDIFREYCFLHLIGLKLEERKKELLQSGKNVFDELYNYCYDKDKGITKHLLFVEKENSILYVKFSFSSLHEESNIKYTIKIS